MKYNRVVTVDPGCDYMAFAVWSLRGSLICVRWERVVSTTIEDIRAWLHYTHVVAEGQFIGGKAAAPRALELARTAGLACGMGASYEFVAPRVWKGNVAKSVTNRRVQRDMSPVESYIVSEWAIESGNAKKDGTLRLGAKTARAADVLAAVGIGHWYFKRRSRRG